MSEKNIFTMMLMLLLIASLILVFNFQSVTARTIVVPDDCPTIQEAIYMANEGDVILVRSGFYRENIKIEKNHLTLKGENAVICGNGRDNVVTVCAVGVHIEGFDIENSTEGQMVSGIYVVDSINVTIYRNRVYNNKGEGILVENSSKVYIINNNVSLNWHTGVKLRETSECKITYNNISYNGLYGIWLWHSVEDYVDRNIVKYNYDYNIVAEITENLTLFNNSIRGGLWGGHWAEFGIDLEGYGCVVFKNIIEDHYAGFEFSGSNLTFMQNVIKNNTFGLRIYDHGDNKLYHNNFLNNTINVYLSTHSSSTLWDNGYPSGGNFWSDYTGVDLYSGPYQNETGSDGIGDIPYVIDENNVDRYPLMAPFETFNVGVWNGTSYNIDVVSNSKVSHLKFNPYEWPPSLEFNVTGVDGTSGFCRVIIPKPLLWAEENQWIIFVGGEEVNYTSYFDGKNTYLYFTYMHSTKRVLIQGTQTIMPFYNLTIISTEGGTTDPVPGNYTYVNGTVVSITAIPNPGYSFDYWLLDGEIETENPISILMDSNHVLEAYFVDDIQPDISDPWQDPPPENVQSFQNVTVWVNVTDYGAGVKNVTLWYSLDNGTSWTMLNMTALPMASDTTITYEAIIPGYENCTWITYKIIAYDKAGNNQTKDNNGYFYKYHVIPEFPSSVALLGFLILLTIPLVSIQKKHNRKTDHKLSHLSFSMTTKS